MSQMCLITKTTKFYLHSTFDWVANFFTAQSKKNSKDPHIKGQFKSVKTLLVPARLSPTAHGLRALHRAFAPLQMGARVLHMDQISSVLRV